MKPNQFARIAIRVLAIFLVYRALEFGISQAIQSQYMLGAMNQSVATGGSPALNPGELIKTVRIMTAIGALVPLFLASALWFAAPTLSRWLVGSDEGPLHEHEDESLPLRATLIQVAAIVMIAMAATTLPQLVYDYQWDRRNDPSINLMTSKVYPDAIQFLAKVFVSGVMLLVVKKKFPRHMPQLAEPASGN